ncbi:MAG: prolyl oligopeptidase family serine peptidase [Pseudomonadales bacterium]
MRRPLQSTLKSSASSSNQWTMSGLRYLAMALLLSSCEQPKIEDRERLDYPQTRVTDHVDTYFDNIIADPYRWLEDDQSAETEQWVTRQNNVTQSYLSNIHYRDELKAQLTELWQHPRISAPAKEGRYFYYYENTGLQNHSVLMRRLDNQVSEVFIDPNTFSTDGTISLGQVAFSESAKWTAYARSESGSDWRSIYLMETETRSEIEKPLQNIKFSSITWQGDTGFFYSSYQEPNGSLLTAQVDQHRLYFHKLGTSQSEDTLVFGGNAEEKYRYVGANLTEDQRFLSIQAAQTTAGNLLRIKDLNRPDSDFVEVDSNPESDTYVVASKADQVLVYTNDQAPNGRLVAIDLNAPEPVNWIDVIPEREMPLRVSTGAGYLFAHYLLDARSRLFQYDYEGNLIRELPLPEVGSASRPRGKFNDDVLYYSFSNYKTPRAIYAFDPETGVSRLYFKPAIRFNPAEFETHQVFFTSKDGTRIPMTITHRRGLYRHGKNPTLLYGYGGFNISITPSFSTATALWLMQGGVYAVPNLRGGGEYGRDWHEAGTQHQKQNVFDDFIAAAEYLIDQGYTSPDYLAVQGRSNGGLLVGAIMTQRPDLMKVALPGVGVMDMLRYHEFTAGAGWSFDYGRSDESPAMFQTLLAYSPLHNIKPGQTYPATLITTGDHDDRVVPAHSFKFAATLQAAQTGKAPTLIRIETDAGHGAGTSIEKRIDEVADTLGFALYNMGITQIDKPINE